ncbi:hypothetical protein [Pseudofrankia inefficax]|uniref:Uncharacterized protein n=1 Tax=Pseudofrankia inefficax (strain DSM 45817 / CECT 9037 / DDB 130130 / EuI1c) TaxID=298654 RepID=E3IXF5_PSEI1|nr:hypothetical protein [Pseudofrankia inefficax]ADP78972.1 hypothetical protein FraEuI1c_0897 [Pseudofrankia inefficax]
MGTNRHQTRRCPTSRGASADVRAPCHVDDEQLVNGDYYIDRRPAPLVPLVENGAFRRALWLRSAELVGVSATA